MHEKSYFKRPDLVASSSIDEGDVFGTLDTDYSEKVANDFEHEEVMYRRSVAVFVGITA